MHHKASKKRPQYDIARVYDAPAPDGRYRVLVDQLWPRGIKKADLHLDAWMKELAPSNELRKWFHHEPERWDEFCRRYFHELESSSELIARLRESADQQTVVLLFAARDEEHNNAVALKQFLEQDTKTKHE